MGISLIASPCGTLFRRVPVWALIKLFVIYASKLFEIFSCHLPDVHCYTDDTQLYLLFKPDSHASHVKAVTAMQWCIEDLGQWMLLDRLKLNDDKTEYLLIGTRQQLDITCVMFPLLWVIISSSSQELGLLV